MNLRVGLVKHNYFTNKIKTKHVKKINKLENWTCLTKSHQGK